MSTDDRLYFRQLLSGRDFAVGDPLASQMVNFVYVVGDRATGECLLVDPAYGVDDLVDVVEADGMTVGGVLATHYHPDHVGGSMCRLHDRGRGPAARAGRVPDPRAASGGAVGQPHHRASPRASWRLHDPGERVAVGAVEIELVHTPGHTPGSQCFLVEGRLVSGDTLFLDGCGRTDLPGSDAEQMYESLQRLATLPGDTIVYPGSPLLDAVERQPRRHPGAELRLPPHEQGAVADDVRRLSDRAAAAARPVWAQTRFAGGASSFAPQIRAACGRIRAQTFT